MTNSTRSNRFSTTCPPERRPEEHKPTSHSLEASLPAGLTSPAAEILHLQRSCGNRHVQRVIARARQAAGKAGAGELDSEVEAAIQRARGGGQALDGSVQAQMEPTLGSDLHGVRVHTGAEADRLSRAISARAFTTGRDVFFRQGEYSPGSSSGRELLAHELTHVVQQSGAPAQGRLTLGPVDDPLEREADRAAALVGQSEAGGMSIAGRAAPAVQRWEGDEHQELADTSGGAATPFLLLEAHRRDLKEREKPVKEWPDKWQELHAAGDANQKRMLEKGLTYGEVVALAGDAYEGFDELNAAPLLEIYELIPLMHRRATTAELEKATGGRYLVLAKKNERHFSTTNPGISNRETWRELHLRALAAAQMGDANKAWTLNAMADHYLTDSFSAGHLRVPRSELMRGGISDQIESKVLHDLDNTYGVEVTNDRGDIWTAYGDEHLSMDENRTNRDKIQQAVRLSKQDVAEALAQGKTYVPPKAGVPFAAETLIPRPVDPKKDRWSGRTPQYRDSLTRELPVREADDYTRMRDKLIAREGPDQIRGLKNADDVLRGWVKKHSSEAIGRQSLQEKLRMINLLLDGWVDDEDVECIKKICESVTDPAEKKAIRDQIEPRISSLFNQTQRMHIRGALGR